jgi:hypothetical protein
LFTNYPMYDLKVDCCIQLCCRMLSFVDCMSYDWLYWMNSEENSL